MPLLLFSSADEGHLHSLHLDHGHSWAFVSSSLGYIVRRGSGDFNGHYLFNHFRTLGCFARDRRLKCMEATFYFLPKDRKPLLGLMSLKSHLHGVACLHNTSFSKNTFL